MNMYCFMSLRSWNKTFVFIKNNEEVEGFEEFEEFESSAFRVLRSALLVKDYSAVEIFVVGVQPDIVEDMSALKEVWKFEVFCVPRSAFRVVGEDYSAVGIPVAGEQPDIVGDMSALIRYYQIRITYLIYILILKLKYIFSQRCKSNNGLCLYTRWCSYWI